jgi:hypothetical protein
MSPDGCWRSRPRTGGEHDPVVVSGGLFRNFALVDGRGVATWRWEGSAIAIAPYAPISDTDLHALDVDATAVLRFLG